MYNQANQIRVSICFAKYRVGLAHPFLIGEKKC